MVLLIMGILLTVAVPNFARARDNARQKACISNLKAIADAKEAWALDNHASNGANVTLTALIGVYLNGPQFVGSTPQSRALEFRCPSSDAMYGPTMGVVGQEPLCPTPSARLGANAHVLP